VWGRDNLSKMTSKKMSLNLLPLDLLVIFVLGAKNSAFSKFLPQKMRGGGNKNIVYQIDSHVNSFNFIKSCHPKSDYFRTAIFIFLRTVFKEIN
jgi:hypothetical protein